MPLGDLAGTLLTLLVAFPQVRWVFRHVVDGREFCFDSEPILKELDGVPLTEPIILSFVKQLLHEGIARVQQNIG